MAVISKSPVSRPKAISVATSTDIGTDRASIHPI